MSENTATSEHDPALAQALLELEAAHARIDELTDHVTALELENRELRKQLPAQQVPA